MIDGPMTRCFGGPLDGNWVKVRSYPGAFPWPSGWYYLKHRREIDRSSGIPVVNTVYVWKDDPGTFIPGDETHMRDVEVCEYPPGPPRGLLNGGP